MSEFDFIEKIKERVKNNKRDVILGIGDDCALIKGGNDLLITVDSQVEDIHFECRWNRPVELGKKLVKINISDIYAKGGIPQYALLSIGVNYKKRKRFIDNYISGIIDELESNNIQLIGGNVSSTKQNIFFDMVLIGVVEKGRLRRRDGANPGDIIAVSGEIGDASCGLMILKKKNRFDKGELKLIKRFLYPDVRYFGDREIWNYVTSSIDISDGLAGDIMHILDSSSVGAVIDARRIPLSSELIDYCNRHRLDVFRFALSGGEDYRLLVTLKKDTPEEIIRRIGFSPIGVIIHKKGLKITGISKSYRGFEHF